MKLNQSLQQWVENGFISADQANRIQNFEQSKPRSSRLILGLTMVAVLSISLGGISMIASHWDYIPDWFKLSAYLTSMASLALGAYLRENQPGFVREALPLAISLWTLAGIGLIAQVFHLPSDGWRGLALWSLLCLPMVLRPSNWYVVGLWYLSYFAAWLSWIVGPSIEFMEIQRIQIFFFCSALLLIAASVRSPWCLPKPFGSVTILLGCLGLLLIYPWTLLLLKTKFSQTLFTTSAGVEAGLAVLWLFILSLSIRRPMLLTIFIGLLSLLARIVLIRTYGNSMVEKLPNFLETIFWTMQLISMGIIALQFDKTRLFDFLILLIAGRILTLFVMQFSTLLLTGSGLIFFGCLMLLGLWIWYKQRGQIRHFFKGIWG